MDEKTLIQYNISVVDQYIKEHGREFGSVSWRMAEQSFCQICEYIQQLNNEIIELHKVVASRDEQSI